MIDIKVPSLRERKDDIPLLASSFINEFCIREKKELTVTADVLRTFQEYSWPGNVRQLKNIIERAVVLSQGKVITPSALPEELMSVRKQTVTQNTLRTLKDLEMQALRDALHACNGNKSRACKALGISRKAFYKRLEKLSVV